MKKEELKNFTRDGLEEMFVDLINKMETDGNRYMNEYAKDREKLEYYSYGGALLTKVNFIKGKVWQKNQPIIENYFS